MESSRNTRYLPDLESLSVLTGSLMLALLFIQYIDLPGRNLGYQLPGFYLSAALDMKTISPFLIGILAAGGAYNLIQRHPIIEEGSAVKFWLLPGLFSFVITLALNELAGNPAWWLGYFLSGMVLTAVFVAEYISVDPEDPNFALSAIILQTTAYALFLTLMIALRFSGTRLYLLLPVVAIASFLVSLRTLNLRLQGEWNFTMALTSLLIVTQFTAGLHYLPLSPISFGLFVLGPAYAIPAFLGNMKQRIPILPAVFEPALLTAIFWAAAFFLD